MQLDYTAISFSCQLQICENIFEIQLILLKSRITAQVTTVSVPSLPFFLNLVWHIDQAKAAEQPIDVRHTPDISQRLGSVHYLSDFTDIVIRQHHGTPSKALTALSAVDPQLLGELTFSALLQLIGKRQAGHRLELVSPKSHHTLPEVFFAGILPQHNHSSIVTLSLCTGADIGSVSLLREVHAFLIRQIRGHRGTGQLQSRHGRGDSSRITLRFSEGIKGLLDELCRVRLVDPGCDEQLPNLDRCYTDFSAVG